MKKRIAAGIVVAVVAAFVICLAAGLFSSSDQKEDSEITVFESYSQIQKTLDSIPEEGPYFHALGANDIMGAQTESAADLDAGAEAMPKAGPGSDHSDTYLQVEGVDEADIIKTDGEYIYYTSRLGYDVIIERSQGDETEEVSVISEEETGVMAEELYLTDDRLLIIGSEYEESRGIYAPYNDINTAVCLYDVSDPSKPGFEGKYRQSGSYVSSRVTGGYLYLITTDYLGPEQKRIVPMAGWGDEMTKLQPQQVCSFPEPTMRAFAVAGSFKVSDPDKNISRTRAILGASEEIYCTDKAIYLTDLSFKGNEEYTEIIKAEIGKGKTVFTQSGSVRGRLLNQFAMDEYDGSFRIAVTATTRDRDVNYLYVLDDKLNVTGKVKGFAAGEEIKAVRFLGNMAYVITYEQTDPLFIIDLEDPRSPEMLGSVEITGFSSLLIPYSEDMLIGIGSSTSDGEFGEVEDGIKIALFDINDPERPQVLDSRTYKDIGSDVQYDHRALTVNSSEDWFAVPYISWEDEKGGVIRFTVRDSKLEEIDRYESRYGMCRCLYTGDYLRCLPYDEDKIITFNINR